MASKLDVAVGVAIGAVVGVIGGLALGIYSEAICKTNLNSRARIFSKKGLPKIIRSYNESETDDLFVEDPNCPDPNNLVSFQKYLNSIQNKYDRTIEEARIKKLVDW